MFGALDISASALSAQRTWLDVIAGNVANMYSRKPDGTPYRRHVALFERGASADGKAPGVHVKRIIEDPSPFRKEYNPSHPNAAQTGPDTGYVLMPNVDLSTEMVNAMAAARAYEANVSVMEITKSMTASALRLIG